MNPEIIEMLRRINAFGGIQTPETNPYGIIDESGAFGGFRQKPNPYENVDFGGEQPLGNVVQSQYDDIDPVDFTPEDKYSKMFGDLLGQQPNRDDYKAGVWKKIAAVVGGALTGDMRGVDEIAHGKFRRANEDWKQKTELVGRAAADERARNTQERLYTGQRRSETLRERDIKRKETSDAARIEIDRQKMELAQFKMRNPNWIIKEQRGGNIIAINPQNPSQTMDTGIATGTLSDLEKHNLGVEKAEHLEELRQENRKDLIPIREENRKDLIEKRDTKARGRIEQRENLLRTRSPKTTSSKGESAANTARDLANKAQELITRNPQYSKYVQINGLNVRVNQPGGWGSSSPSQKDYDAIVSQLYPNGQQQNDGRIKVVGPNGETGTMLKSELSKYPGWKEAR